MPRKKKNEPVLPREKKKVFYLNIKIKDKISGMKLKVIPPQEVKCPEGYKLVITEDGFAACAREE